MTFDPSKPVAADHGRPVRILVSDLKGGRPICAAHTDANGVEAPISHIEDGRYSTLPSEYDLHNVPERTTVAACASLRDMSLFTCVDWGADCNVSFTFEGDKLVAVELIGDE